MKKNEHKGKEEPTVCYCEEERHLKPGARFGPVVRDVFIIECCEEGYGSVIINGKEFAVTPRSCYVLFPGDTVIHVAHETDPRKGVWCSVDGLNVGRHLALAGLDSQNPFAPSEKFEELASWVRKMVAVWRQDSAGASLLLTPYVYGFLGTLLQETPRENASEEWVDRVLGLIQTRYHEPLTVSHLAKEAGLDRAYFSTLFKEKTGLSPHRYLTELRIGKACSLLQEPSRSVSEVASAVGLDPRNFARLFKAETGKTPLEYRS